jgi:hypothetical protein
VKSVIKFWRRISETASGNEVGKVGTFIILRPGSFAKVQFKQQKTCGGRGAFAVEAAEPPKKILSISNDYEVAALIPIGYPKDYIVEQRPTSLQETLHYNIW